MPTPDRLTHSQVVYVSGYLCVFVSAALWAGGYSCVCVRMVRVMLISYAVVCIVGVFVPIQG